MSFHEGGGSDAPEPKDRPEDELSVTGAFDTAHDGDGVTADEPLPGSDSDIEDGPGLDDDPRDSMGYTAAEIAAMTEDERVATAAAYLARAMELADTGEQDDEAKPPAPEGRVVDSAEAAKGAVFLDSLYPMDGSQPSIPLSEQKAAGSVVTEAVQEYVAGGAYDAMMGEVSREQTYKDVNGYGYVVAANDVNPVNQEIALYHAYVFEEVLEDTAAITGTRGVHYEIGPDGIAYRTDERPKTPDEVGAGDELDDLTDKISDLLDNEQELSDEEILRYAATLRDMLQERVAADDIEAQMGMRRQPIGLAEAQRLANLLRGRDLNE